MIHDLKPYPVMKDTGVEWLGEVPGHWEVLPNRAIFMEIKEREHPEEQMLSVTITKGVIPQQKLLADSSKKDSSNQDKSAYKLVQPGDIAYNKMRAWQGAIGASGHRGIISPAYVVQRPRGGAYPRYFHYLLRTPSFAKEAERWSYGITSDMWSLRPEHFKMIYGCVPALPEQSAIVRYLNYMDRRIRKYIRAKQKLIKLLEEQKQAIIHRAVTRGLDPNVRLKPSGVEWLEEVPEHWEVRKIGSLGIFYKGRGIARTDITDTGVPAITYGDIYTKYGIEIKSLGKYTSSAVAANAQKIVKGDLLFTASGETIEEIGKTTLYSGEVTGYAGGDIIILQLHNGDGLYLSYALNCEVGIRQKSTFGRGDIIVHISSSKLKQVVVPFPPLEEQAAIAKHLDQSVAHVATAISHTHREIALLREYRTRLIADVVTGKLDVRAAAAKLPEETGEPEAIDDTEETPENETDSAVEEVADAEQNQNPQTE